MRETKLRGDAAARFSNETQGHISDAAHSSLRTSPPEVLTEAKLSEASETSAAAVSEEIDAATAEEALLKSLKTEYTIPDFQNRIAEGASEICRHRGHCDVKVH